MKKVVVILTLVLTLGNVAFSQHKVFIYIQKESNAGYDQYYDSKYGIKTWMKRDKDFEEIEEDIFKSKESGAIIKLKTYEDWVAGTYSFIDEVRKGNANALGQRDSILMVYVGHNVLNDTVKPRLDTTTKEFKNCYDNMLFG